MDDRASQAAAGALEPQPASRKAGLRERHLRQARNGDPAVGKLLKRERQNPTTHGDRQHLAVAAKAGSGVDSRRKNSAHAQTELVLIVDGMRNTVRQRRHRTCLPINCGVSRKVAPHCGHAKWRSSVWRRYGRAATWPAPARGPTEAPAQGGAGGGVCTRGRASDRLRRFRIVGHHAHRVQGQLIEVFVNPPGRLAVQAGSWCCSSDTRSSRRSAR